MREALRRLLTATSSRTGPSQIAAAVALGILAGFTATSSLLFFVLLALACCLPIHLPLMLATTFLIAVASPLLHSTLGQIGLSSLMHPNMHAMWLRLDSIPLVPWLGLHNTVIHGGVIFGLGALLPAFLITRPMAIWVLGNDWAAARHNVVDSTREVVEDESHIELADLLESDSTDDQATLVADLEALLATPDSDLTTPLPSTPDVVARAARVAGLVDDVLTTLQQEDGTGAEPEPANAAESPIYSGGSEVATDSTIGAESPELTSAADSKRLDSGLQIPPDDVPNESSPGHAAESTTTYTSGFHGDGTIIEISVPPPRSPDVEPKAQHRITEHQPHAENAMLNVHVSERERANGGNHSQSSEENQGATLGQEDAPNKDTGMLRNETRHQEALRYLLSHLRELKEKV